MAALRKQKTKTNSGVTANEKTIMSNYFRISGYCPEKDFSFIMDCYGKFEKKWQFSAELVKRGLKIIEVSDDEQFLEGNIPLLANPTNKLCKWKTRIRYSNNSRNRMPCSEVR